MATRKTSEMPALAWQGADYARIPPGDYQAACVAYQGPDWIRSYKRWSIRLEFSLLWQDACVSAFLNMGSNPEAPQIGRRSKYYALWCQVNGEMPRKGQLMHPEVFTEPGLFYVVRVEDSCKDAKDELKPEALVYSRVTEILAVEHP